jgi:hypothetical protein
VAFVRPAFRVHRASRGRHLTVDAADTHRRTVGLAFPDEAGGAADAQVDLADRHRPAVRPEQPLAEELGFREGVEDEGAGGVEFPRHEDLALSEPGALEHAEMLRDRRLGHVAAPPT